jgi:membrane-associated phospholipid phosphatase
MKQKAANFISIIGHPLFTIPVFVAIVMFMKEDLKKATFISFLIIGCIFVPLILRMRIKSKNGTYTNFDVSDRIQRKSLFVFIIPLLIAVTIILFVTQQDKNLCISMLFATILALISQFINLFIKSSLHISLHIFLAFLVMTISYKIGAILFLFTVLLGWSRIVLGRHTIKEVIVGGAIGLIIGFVMFYIEGYI